MLGIESYLNNFFCGNAHLFYVPRSWTGSVQMKSSITFIRGNMCIERKIILKMAANKNV